MDILRIINKGMFSTIQDDGRSAYRKYGVPTSGAMDMHAIRSANLLLGNAENAPVIEITYGAFQCQFLQDIHIAVTGGDLCAQINGDPLPLWQTIHVKSGDILSFQGGHSGYRAYLAVQSGFDYPSILGSASVYTRAGFNQLLQDSEVLRISAEPQSHSSLGYRQIPDDLQPVYDDIIRVMPGPHSRFFRRGYAQFLKHSYKVLHTSDRMGIRLEGPIIRSKKKNLLSCPLPIGSIQMPPSGQPIIVMADGQVIGGYPIIAHVASMDIKKLAQLCPGQAVHFQHINQATAVSGIQQEQEQLDTIRQLPDQDPSYTQYRIKVNGQLHHVQVKAID